MLILDTNVISELRKIDTASIDERAKAWFETEEFETSYLTTITIFELESGIVRLELKDKL